MSGDKESLVTFLMGMWHATRRFHVTYTHKEDTQGQTNIKNAQRRVIEATLKYIKDNNL